MTGSAITLMVLAIVIIWGGLIASSISLFRRGRREQAEAASAARADARAHLRGQS